MPLDADVDEWRDAETEKDRETVFPALDLSGNQQNRQTENQPLRFTNSQASSTKKQQRALEGTTIASSAAAAPQTGKKRRGDEDVWYGVEIWTQSDATGLQYLVDLHGAKQVQEVAAGLTPLSGHRAPFLSAVVSAFHALAAAEVRQRAQDGRQREEKPAASPEVAAVGLKKAKTALRKGIAAVA